MATTWTWDGANTVSVTIDDAVTGHSYSLDCDDPNSTTDVQTAAGSTLTLTVGDVGGLDPSDTFQALVTDETASAPTHCNVFQDGVSAVAFPYSASWSYDGTTVSVTFTAIASTTYHLQVIPGGGTTNGGPYTGGTSQTLTRAASSGGGPNFEALLWWNHTTNGDLSDRVFVYGASSSGASGNGGGEAVSGGPSAPTASFTATPTSGEAPLVVAFTDTSANTPTSWLWDFGDGATSTAQNPSHTYATNGTFTVALTATNVIGSDTQTETDLIVVTAAGRVLIACDDGPLEPDPTWTRIDDTPNLVAEINISRGRQTEMEQTDTSTAVVHLNDTDGTFDPANISSPYFGKLDGKQIMLQLWNPVTSAWVPQYRGVIDDYGYDLHPSQVVSNIQVECVDLFDYLAGVEMIPGLFGGTPPAGSEGVVFYEDGDVQTRIVHLLEDAFAGDTVTAAARSVVFTGNVDVQETRYDPGDSILVALRDAADAEFPGIANLYTDKIGRFVFHGRKARFTPETVAATVPGKWTFTRWKAGDGAAIALDGDRAQIRPQLSWSRPRSRIVNAALCYQRGIAESAIPGQVVTDATSRDAYGYRSWSATDLITQSGTTTGNNATDETKLFASWRVANYKDPRTLVEALTFRSLDPSDARATATWALICGVDISDIIDLEHGYPGGVGLSENFYVEGSEMTIVPLNDGYDDVTLTVNVSPSSDYSDDVFA